MKIILLGDLHFGEGRDSKYVQMIQKDLIEQVIEYAKENNIRVALQSGDWFDVRSGVSQETQNFMRTTITPMLKEAFDEIHVLVGNHDMHHKHYIVPNSIYENLTDPVYKVYQDPTSVNFDGVWFDIIPWECRDNKEKIREFINNSVSDYSIGHWELLGFDFYSGIVSPVGEDSDFLRKYKIAFSGHYHTASKKGNVVYLGTPYTITMNDVGDRRGFYVFDTETGDYQFVENRNMWHVKVKYNSSLDLTDVSAYTNKCVQLLIEEEDKNLDSFETKLEKVCQRVVKKSLVDLKSVMSDDGEEIEVKKIQNIMVDHINSLDIEETYKKKVSEMISTLYNEAISV